MFDGELGNLLRQADEGFTPELPAARETARRVRELDRRRRQRERRLAAGAVLVVLVATGLTAWSWNESRRETAQPIAAQMAEVPSAATDGTDTTPDDLEMLAAEAESHLRLARRMMADREQEEIERRVMRDLAQPDPIDEVRERLDVVAFRMVSEADRLLAAMQPAEEAIAIYREVIRLFPETSSAHIARERLSALAKS